MSNDNQVLETILNALKKELETDENLDETELTGINDADVLEFNGDDADVDDNNDDDDADNGQSFEKNSEQLKLYDYNETVVMDDYDGDNVAEVDSAVVNPTTAKAKTTISLVKDGTVDVFTCTDCTYKTNKRILLTRHLKTHSKERPYKCTVCDRAFKSNTALQNHVNSHLGKKPYQCKSCEMRFNTSGELSRHVRYKHTHEKPHKCAECDYSSVELSKMRRHMRCHTGERPYQCPHCTYASPDSFKLKRHLRTHTGEKPYECDICLARFTQSNTLKSHKLIHSVSERPIFQCTLCPTTCGRKTDLQYHIQKLHTSDQPIKCKRCGKELPDRYNYKMHVKTHEGEKCFRCKICPYASISQRHLDMHMLVHTDEKPFTCEQCEMAFRQRQLLIRHVNIYHNKDYVPPEPQEKKHNCPHCRRAFSRKGNLMRHMELHDGGVENELQKDELKRGRKIHITNLNHPKLNDEHFDQIVRVVDKAERDSEELSDQHEQEDCKFIDTFEIIDDTSNSITCINERNLQNKQKSKRTSSLVTSSIALPSSTANIFIVPSSNTSKTTTTTQPAKKEQDKLPIKIEIATATNNFGNDDTNDYANDDDDQDFYVIEVIEEDAMDNNELDNSILADCIIGENKIFFKN